jgi:hypothetical protein
MSPFALEADSARISSQSRLTDGVRDPENVK